MRLESLNIEKFRNFSGLEIDFTKSDFSDVFSIASVNGGGKSTLLQFIFIMLNCFYDNKKHHFIKNLLNNQRIQDNNVFAKFSISHNSENYFLNFQYMKNSKQEDVDFNVYLDLQDIEERLQVAEQNNEKFQKIIQLQKECASSERVTPIIQHIFSETREFINNSRLDRLYARARNSDELKDYQEYIDYFMNSRNLTYVDIDELENMHTISLAKKETLEHNLAEQNLRYIMHLNKDFVLLFTSNMNNDLLLELTKKVFLNAPQSQIFLFLNSEEKNTIFNNFGEKGLTFQAYESFVKRAKAAMNNFFTYDFASTNLILESFEKAYMEDKQIKRTTGEYGNKYDELVQELNNFLEGKEISEEDNPPRVIFKVKNTNQELQPEDLSHGELKKLSIYLWLKYFIPQDSIILMDEIDIALHPKWQYQIINDITSWSKHSQFLIATHSPQILSSTYYKNIIILKNEKSFSQVMRLKKPPLGKDINSTIEEIMGSHIIPQELFLLFKKYREYLEKNQIDSENAKTIKKQILEYENENSAFFQDIAFDIELRK